MRRNRVVVAPNPVLREGRRWALWGLLLLACAPAWAQPPAKVWRIGVTQIVTHAALDADERGFEAGLASAGFKEGVNVTFERYNALGDLVRADAIARRLVNDQVDLIHAIATPTTQAVVRTGTRIPVVFSSVTDPVYAGIVPRDSAPGRKTGRNVTGLSDLWPVDLQLQAYVKLVPNAKTWGTIFNPAEANSVMHIQAMRKAMQQLGLNLLEVNVNSSQEVEQAAQSLVGKAQAIVITSDNTSVANLEAIARVCDTNKIALFAGDVDSVERGAVMAYGMDYFLIGYAAGKKAALILKGARPGDIPWGPVDEFSLVVNTRAARAQGVTLPPDLLAKADKVLR